MNSVQLSGTLASAPAVLSGNETAIRFVLKARYPSGHAQTGAVRIPCNVFDATPEQREILLGKNCREFRAEVSGRLAVTACEDERGSTLFNIEVIANPNGLMLQRVK